MQENISSAQRAGIGCMSEAEVKLIAAVQEKYKGCEIKKADEVVLMVSAGTNLRNPG